MKRSIALLLAGAFSLAGFQAFAQSTTATTPNTTPNPTPSATPSAAPTTTQTDHAKAAKDKKKAAYAAKQKAMHDASKSSASGPVAGASTDKTVPKNRPTGADAMESQMNMQENKPSKPVDKNATGAPRPNASKMTQAERDAYRKEVVKESKP